MRDTWVGTSWKMHKTLAQARTYAVQLAEIDHQQWDAVQVFVLPPATALHTVVEALGPSSPVMVGAQNAHWCDEGPWTGEVSVPQVADAGASMVEIGHAERRAHFGETDHTVNLKVHAALRHGIRPLVCVGEPASAKGVQGSVDYVCRQARAALEGIGADAEVLLAYEPVWAIGDGAQAARPEDVAPVCRALSDELSGADVLYGGSVGLENAADLICVDGVDGLFIGRAAWDVGDFVAIIEAVAANR
ncbi:MAG: triose-phosphate isomerase [Ornithinimicrobium sp.]|uniref:triose-phosphate isomerase n=1 Tax=Ornithinimicrobium sp. TaxID=1977084 RepID=UPI003D9B1777